MSTVLSNLLLDGWPQFVVSWQPIVLSQDYTCHVHIFAVCSLKVCMCNIVDVRRHRRVTSHNIYHCFNSLINKLVFAAKVYSSLVH